jgi:GntR family transcriptional regulator / MocR family aminotransferase
MTDRQNPTIDQAALASFISDGHLSRHIRRMRSLYAARQTALLDLARRHLTGLLQLEPTDSGMHVVGWLPDGVDDRAVAQRARTAGLDVAPLSVHYLETPRRPGLLLGFAPFDESKLADGVVRLTALLRSVLSPAA